MPEADAGAVGRYLASVNGSPSSGGTELTLVGGGRSNLTFVVRHDGREYVLRRPPAPGAGAGGHDIGREYRILSALFGTAVPVARPIALCDDASVLGAPFYLMERVAGRVLVNSADAPDLRHSARLRTLAAAAIGGLVAIHSVDPQQVGLGELGDAAGYVERQVKRWSRQWAERRQREIPALDELGRRLRNALVSGAVDPVPDRPYLVHGDYNLGNLIVAGPDAFEGDVLRAVLDWELSTLGHPLMDLALLTAYNGPHGRLIVEADELVSDLPGFPGVAELVDVYAAASGRDVSAFDFFYVLALFKVMVINEDVRARYLAGTTIGEGFEAMGRSAVELAGAALDYADRSLIAGLNDR